MIGTAFRCDLQCANQDCQASCDFVFFCHLRPFLCVIYRTVANAHMWQALE